MVLIGAGQGLAFAPLTSFGIVGVAARTPAPPAGWSTPPTSSAWPLGLAVLVAASAGAPTWPTGSAVALTWGTGLLALCLLVVLAVVVPAQRRAARTSGRTAAEPVEAVTR